MSPTLRTMRTDAKRIGAMSKVKKKKEERDKARAKKAQKKRKEEREKVERRGLRGRRNGRGCRSGPGYRQLHGRRFSPARKGVFARELLLYRPKDHDDGEKRNEKRVSITTLLSVATSTSFRYAAKRRQS